MVSINTYVSVDAG